MREPGSVRYRFGRGLLEFFSGLVVESLIIITRFPLKIISPQNKIYPWAGTELKATGLNFNKHFVQALMISVNHLSKSYRIHDKQPGLIGSVKALLRRHYYEVDAVKDISFTVEPGEVVAFVGPNGSGKTTTLKTLSGLLHPSAGKVTVAGYTPCERRKDFLKSIALVMGQKQQLVWDISAADTFLLNKAVYEVSDVDYQHRLGLLVEMLGLKKVIHRQVRRLSLGERMKCEFVAALLHQPKILFLDEPTIGLDLVSQKAIRSFLKDYNDQFNSTIMITSHHVDDLRSIADRMIVISQGSLKFDDSFRSILERLSPFKKLSIQLDQPAADDLKCFFPRMERINAYKFHLLVEHAQVSDTIKKLAQHVPLSEISVTEEPLEDIMVRVMHLGD
jgi:ABC-2 type transport system ATP-binding protein